MPISSPDYGVRRGQFASTTQVTGRKVRKVRVVRKSSKGRRR
jgi:hypothetical protein